MTTQKIKRADPPEPARASGCLPSLAPRLRPRPDFLSRYRLRLILRMSRRNRP